jgi:hypothetical protein
MSEAISHHVARIIAARPDFYQGEGDKFRFRRQAAAAYPLLAPLFPVRFSLRGAIDRGEPLAGHLQTAFKLSKATVSRLAKLDYDPQDDLSKPADIEARSRLAAALNEIDPNWWPQNPAETSAFIDAVRIAHFHLAPASGLSPKLLLSAAGGKWPAFLTRLNAAAFPSYMDGETRIETPAYSFENLRNASDSVQDMRRSFAVGALYPAAAKLAKAPEILMDNGAFEAMDKAATAILFEGRTAAAILELSARWHTSAGEIEQCAIDAAEGGDTGVTATRISNTDPNNKWPAAVPDYNIDGFIVRCLVSYDELKEETKRLKHCVGRSRAYADEIRDCKIMIVSVRSANDEISFSTAEVTIPKPGGAFGTVLQHRAGGNASPSERILRVFDNWKRAVINGNIPINFDALSDYAKGRAWSEEKIASRDRLADYLGYNWRIGKNASLGLQTWSRLRNPAIEGGEVPAPWLSKRYSTDPDVLASSVPAFADAICAIGPDGDYALERREKRIAEHFSEHADVPESRPMIGL